MTDPHATPGLSDEELIKQLSDLSRAEHDDLSIAVDAADRIAALSAERDAALAENERLWEALLWIDHYEPELTAVAEKKFGFSLSLSPYALTTAKSEG